MKSKTGSKYPSDWPVIAQSVKKAAGNKCVRCGQIDDPAAGYALTVHHLDMDPANCRWWNIPPLCQRCHLHVQAKIVMRRIWFVPHPEWFQPYVAGYTAHRVGLNDERSFVMANVQALLEIASGIHAVLEGSLQ